MEELTIPVTLTLSKGSPFEGRALLERTMRGGLVVALTDLATYWELSSFHKRVQSHLGSFLSGDRQRAWEITSVSDAPLLGAAIAALTN